MRRRPFPPFLPGINAFPRRNRRVTIRLAHVRALHYDCNCNYIGGPIHDNAGEWPATQQ
ncbi:hypothetical protein BCO18430_05604 [Burkholderia contaminans]|nr:hypothetical protein BCO19218_03284 [Burkholderia contaminans]VWD25158.1 hypothetical protein BCO18430_05604 [Burkholderia contaminans]